jgi:hypothetical protein
MTRGDLIAAACVAATVMLVAVAADARAQTPERKGGSFLYGVSFGAGRRTTSGEFDPAQLPATAKQPPSPISVGALDIESGITINSRLAVVGFWEGRTTFGGPSGGWGIAGGHAAVRAWIVPRVWVEGGVGPMELAYRAENPQTPTTRWWTAGYEAGGGYEVFQGASVTLQVFARYTTATIEGLRVQTLTVQFGLMGRTH